VSTAVSSGFQIRDWRPHQKETLRAFFTIVLPSGLVIYDCRLHQKGDRRWIGMPTKTFESQGEKKFQPIVDFIDRDAEDRFRIHVLNAIDQHLREAGRDQDS
jgi:DNA-binding cell septation regulator SpoVG